MSTDKKPAGSSASNNMNRQHSLTDQVAEFLAEQDFPLFRSEENSFFGNVTIEGGVDISLWVDCKCSSTPLVRVSGILPIAVPASLQGEFVSVLNAINQSILCGRFAMDPQDGRVSLENSAMIPDGEHPRAQLRWLLFLNEAIMRREALTLMRLATGALTERDALSLIGIESGDSPMQAESDPERIRWN